MSPGKKFSFFILGFSLAGAIWLIMNHFTREDIPGCLFRYVTGIPCPSCGITGTIGLLFGDPSHFFIFNILAFVLIPLMIIAPFWAAADLITGRDGMFRTFKRSEEILRKLPVAFLLIILLAVVWSYNIYQFLFQ